MLRIELPEKQEPDLNDTVPSIRANLAWALQSSPQLRGREVCVAIIDSGIDVLHQSFQDVAGNTRILALWDQTFDYDATTGVAVDTDDDPLTGDAMPRAEDGTPLTQASNRTPATHPIMPGNVVNPAMSGLDWGAEFTREQINTALDRHANNDQAIPISLRDDPKSDNHGTHVAGIAAGNGQMEGRCAGAGTFVGVAPEADLIIVKVGFEGKTRNDIEAALDYVFAKARTWPSGKRPVSVNMSLGRSAGPHNGFSFGSLYQRNLLTGSTGEAIVRSAGNTRDDAIHAAVTVPANGETSVDISIARNTDRAYFWMSFPTGSNFEYDFQLPGSGTRKRTSAITISSGATVTEHGHSVNPDPQLSRDADPDAHADVSIRNSTEDEKVAAGTWTLTVDNKAASPLHLHIWSSSWRASFVKPDSVTGSAQNPSQPEDWLKGTIGVDANAPDVIAVGAYGVNGSDRTIAPFSSQGPSPLGLSGGLYPAGSLAKPDISAPGVGITSAAAEAFDCFLMCECCVENYIDMKGTSQASPHVAGVVALMLQADPTLTHTEILQMLKDSAATAPTLGGGWPPSAELFGAGPVDARDAVQEVLDNLASPREQAAEIARAHRIASTPAFQRIAEVLRGWEIRFGARPAWHFFAGLVSTHFSEVSRLINTQKRVGAVWQRNGGPGLVRTLVMSDRDIDPPIPEVVGEKRMDVLIDRLIPVLRRFATPRLLADIERYEALARALPGQRFDQIDDLFGTVKS